MHAGRFGPSRPWPLAALLWDASCCCRGRPLRAATPAGIARQRLCRHTSGPCSRGRLRHGCLRLGRALNWWAGGEQRPLEGGSAVRQHHVAQWYGRLRGPVAGRRQSRWAQARGLAEAGMGRRCQAGRRWRGRPRLITGGEAGLGPEQGWGALAARGRPFRRRGQARLGHGAAAGVLPIQPGDLGLSLLLSAQLPPVVGIVAE
mmetsp:Transcript_71310/g.202255  ORF Transcript_71310/g.202255 Transcript_71310/m.202255 type:complete len:203 (+) Transcript_71310:655-1263(+)